MKPADAEKLLVRRLGPRLSELAFKRKGTTWYRYDKEVSQVLAVEPWGRFAVILGAAVRQWNRTTHPEIRECHLQVGMSFLVPDYSYWLGLRDYAAWESEVDLRPSEFVECVLQYGLPVLNSWRSLPGVLEYVHSPDAAKTYVAEELRSMSPPRGNDTL